MMNKPNNLNSLSVEDIRKIREYYAEKYTDENNNIDWSGLGAEMEKGADVVRAEIARIRRERAVAM